MKTQITVKQVIKTEPVATAVYDRGRRGNPLPGCDCVQCFGYCMVDGDEAQRVRAGQNKESQDEHL